VTIPPGEVGRDTGTTLTPVRNSSDDPPEQQGLVGRLRDVVKMRWESLTGRGVRLDGSSGETTPLIDRSTQTSPRGSSVERRAEDV
jgi:hypothetical protein